MIFGVSTVSKLYRNIIIFALLTAFIVLAAASVFNDVPVRDVAHRYAPMADAFASGDFAHAFDLRVPPLHTICAGLVSFVSGVDGFTGCKIAAILWHFAGMILLYQLVKTVYPQDKKIAVLSLALYAVFPYTNQMAYYGLREPLKTFILLLSALSLIKIKLDTKNIFNYILLGIACGFAATTRSDMIITAIFFIFCGAFFECQSSRFPIKSVLAYITATALLLPNICINYHLFKSAMPDFRFAAFYQKCMGNAPGMTEYFVIAFLLCAATITGAWIFEKITRKVDVKYFAYAAVILMAVTTVFAAAAEKFNTVSVSKFIEAVLEGFHSLFGIIILVYLIIRSRFQKLSSAESIVITTVLANAFINIVSIQLYHRQLYVSSRYLHPALPLLFGFFVCAVRYIHTLLCSRYTVKIANTVVAVLVIYTAADMLIHTVQPVVRNYTRKKNIIQRKKVLKLAEMIKTDSGGRHSAIYFTSDNKITAAAYLAGGRMVSTPQNADYIVTCDNNADAKLLLLGAVEGCKNRFYLWRVKK